LNGPIHVYPSYWWVGMGNMRPLPIQLGVKPTTHSQLVLGLIIRGAVSSPFHTPSWYGACLKRTGTASLLWWVQRRPVTGVFRHSLDLRVTWMKDVMLKLCEGVPYFSRGLEVVEHTHILHLYCKKCIWK